jgi:hypothetical protein
MNKKPILCHICGRPIDLTLGTVADEKGQTVHELCYVKNIVAPTDKPKAPETNTVRGPLSLVVSLCGRVQVT